MGKCGEMGKAKLPKKSIPAHNFTVRIFLPTRTTRTTLPPLSGVFGFIQQALSIEVSNINLSEVSESVKAVSKVQNAINDMLLGEISRSDFLEIVDSCEMLGIDDYLDQVEENLEALGLI